ncbi:MAG TPA: efflux RND transporter permease subunit [Pirellulales bacterium]|jgi:CzcA family heavy metal efflux pump|nr:efflux RND transporter permease subunit [Pirellulales bacterium]
MTWLVGTSLRLRAVVLALAVVMMVYGLRTLEHAPLDVFPEFAPPLVEIQTEAPGLSTEEVESLVTMPLENALNGIPFLSTLRSKSVLGLSSIKLIFQPGSDLIRSRQLVQERLAVEATRLPAVARPPVMLSPLSSTSRVMKIGLSSQKLSQMELTELARWTIRPRLMAVQGVANVAIWGQRDRQFQVLVDPERLRAHSLSLGAVERAAADAVVQAGGGFVDTPNQRIAVRQLTGVLSADDLAAAVVDFRKGAPLRLGDVAQVVEGFPSPIGDAVINDGPGLLLIVEKQPWGNTLDVTHKVEKALDALGPGLTDVEIDPAIFRPATFIERSLENLSHAMLVGCLLVIVILVAFLFDWRTSLISLTAIPLSLVAASVVLAASGATLNTMVIAGLVIALGEVVDDAIIDVENILRRLKLNRESDNPRPAFDVVFDASLEVRSAVVYASLIVTLVFVPVLFLEGLPGSFFRPLAMAYILAILASLLTALTVTPAMSLMLLPGASSKRHEAPLTRWLKSVYMKLLPPLVGRPFTALALLVVVFVATLVAGRRLGQEFLPNFKETDFLMHWVEKPGTSLDAMTRLTIRVSKELRKVQGVKNFGSHIGRAEVADEVVGPNFTELWISVDPEYDVEETMRRVQDVVEGYPGLYRDVLTYLKERIKEVLTGAKATIVVRIFGPELATLRDTAQEVFDAMSGVKGVATPHIGQQTLVPQIQVRLRPDAAARFGLTAGQVRHAVQTLVRGTVVGEVYYGQKSVPVMVWGVPGVRTDLEALRRLPIDLPRGSGPAAAPPTPTPAGGALASPIPAPSVSAAPPSTASSGYVTLGDVADVEIVPAPNEILRESASRYIDVTCNVQGRDLGSVAREIEQRVKELPFARGYHPEFIGEYAARQEASRRLLLLAAMSLVGILLLLYVDFSSWRLSLLVFLTIPFALVGGVVGAWLDTGVLSLGSLVGFVTVLGIAARNGIMLVSHYRHLEEVEGEPFGLPLVLRGSAERLAPILMTALATGLALVPLIVRGNLPGHEIEYPMAVVILGGLVTSTLLNLFLLPPLYAAWGRVGDKAA